MTKFDVVIGNPPYTKARKDETSTTAGSLYEDFVIKSYNISNGIICNIIPFAWTKQVHSKKFRKQIADDLNIKYIKVGKEIDDYFKNVAVNGGVCYFISDKSDTNKDISLERDGKISNFKYNDIYDFFIEDDILENILNKIHNKTNKFLSELYYTWYGINSTDFKDLNNKYFENSYPVIGSALKSKNDIRYINKFGTYGFEKFNTTTWKCIFPTANGSLRFFTKIIEPGILTSRSVSYFSFKTEIEAKNCDLYLFTKFAIFLRRLNEIGRMCNSPVFRFIPLLDFTQEWSDEKLYEYFQLTQDEIAFIEKNIPKYYD
jgi:hypothetical protein